MWCAAEGGDEADIDALSIALEIAATHEQLSESVRLCKATFSAGAGLLRLAGSPVTCKPLALMLGCGWQANAQTLRQIGACAWPDGGCRKWAGESGTVALASPSQGKSKTRTSPAAAAAVPPEVLHKRWVAASLHACFRHNALRLLGCASTLEWAIRYVEALEQLRFGDYDLIGSGAFHFRDHAKQAKTGTHSPNSLMKITGVLRALNMMC